MRFVNATELGASTWPDLRGPCRSAHDGLGKHRLRAPYAGVDQVSEPHWVLSVEPALAPLARHLIL
jgi:hypothetical protein